MPQPPYYSTFQMPAQHSTFQMPAQLHTLPTKFYNALQFTVPLNWQISIKIIICLSKKIVYYHMTSCIITWHYVLSHDIMYFSYSFRKQTEEKLSKSKKRVISKAFISSSEDESGTPTRMIYHTSSRVITWLNIPLHGNTIKCA